MIPIRCSRPLAGQTFFRRRLQPFGFGLVPPAAPPAAIATGEVLLGLGHSPLGCYFVKTKGLRWIRLDALSPLHHRREIVDSPPVTSLRRKPNPKEPQPLILGQAINTSNEGKPEIVSGLRVAAQGLLNKTPIELSHVALTNFQVSSKMGFHEPHPLSIFSTVASIDFLIP